jgi:predicted N-acetyltransferase YhbS
MAAGHTPALRRAVPGDAAVITALVNRAYEVEADLFGASHRRTDLPEIEASFEEPGVFFLLAEDGGRVIASVRVETQPDGLYFGMLAVEPAAQRAGVGRGMVAAVEREARALGLPFVRLVCIKERGLAAYYTRLGYVAAGEVPENWAGVAFHFVRMEKRTGA